MPAPGSPLAREKLTLLSFGVKKPVATNLLMFAIIFVGIVFGLTLRREMFPDITPTRAAITIIYPGASPEEVEEGIVLKVEDKVATIEEVDEIISIVTEGGGTVMIEFKAGREDIDDLVNDVKAALDTIEDLPEEAEELRTTKFEPTLPVISLNIFGDVGEENLKRSIQFVRDDLERFEEIGQIEIYGFRKDEIRVEVNPDALVKYGLSLPEVASRVRWYMQDMPGGLVRTSRESVRIRVVGVEERTSEIRNIVVKSDPRGGVVRLGDIAEVRDEFADDDVVSRINGKPNATATILNVDDGDSVKMAEVVRGYAAGLRGEEFDAGFKDYAYRVRSLFSRQSEGGASTDANTATIIDALSPKEQAYRLGLARADDITGEVVLTNDLARFIEDRLALLTRNAAMGAVLVFLVLLLVLNVRVAMWVMLGLVISLLGTLAFMSVVGITLNLLTMFGLIVVLGLLVDDAIVVAENIVARHESGETALSAAINGVRQIAWPVVATILTTIAAFLPLRLIEGQIGDFLGALPVVVACALSVSLLEALVILPAHMGHSLKAAEHKKPGRIMRFFRALEDRRNALIRNRIVPAFGTFVEFALHYRYVATATAIALWVISIGMFVGGRVEFTFFAASDSEIVVIDLRMPVGTSLKRTNSMIRRIEDAAYQQDEVKTIETLVGTRLDTNDWNVSGALSHIGQLYVELKPVEVRERLDMNTSPQVIANIRRDLGDLEGISSIRYEEVQGGPGGEAINIVVTGDDIDRMRTVSERLQSELTEFDGVYDVSDDLEVGQRELQIELLDGASGLGLTPASIAEQIRGAVYGLEPHTFSSNREDVDVRVTMSDAVRENLYEVENLYIFTPTGERVPLIEVARLSEKTGYSTIRRLNRDRSITVLGDVDQAVTNPEAVIASMKPYFAQLEAEFTDIRVEARGRQLETAKSLAGIREGFMLASVLIYIVLAWLFGSYFQPIAVMLGIPFAMIGVIWGHYITGFEIMILSLIGFVALTGIVVNDSLILIEFYNHKRTEGMNAHDAMVETARRRLRPILLTTATTVLGLLPLMLETSFQARFLIPMAVAISFGLMSATLLILVVLPCMILIGEDLKHVFHFIWTGRTLPKQTGTLPAPQDYES